MPDAQDIARQVRANCEVCNARNSGGYSVCGLLLRLRNLFKWETGLEPWQEPEPADVLAWIEAREQEWGRLAEADFSPIRIGGRDYGPFDAAAINRRLKPLGLIYGAGYGWALKPTFFLGRLEGTKTAGGRRVSLVGRELARDLFISPAMLQDEQVIIRSDAARYFLWDRLMDVKKSGREALIFGLANYGLDPCDISPERLREAFPRILAGELDACLRHEVGETRDDVFPREVWRGLIDRFPGERVELVARALKDALADTSPGGMLSFIIRGRRAGSLGLYVAFLDGVRVLLLPEIARGFKVFREDGRWSGIERARRTACERLNTEAARLMAILSEDGQKDDGVVAARIEREVMAPLGI